MDEIDLLLYLPGSFVCRRCHFLLEKRTISASTGQIGVRKAGEAIEPCPNCAIPLERMTWKEAYEAIAEQAGEINIALVESVQLQSHYAKLLNMHDGGERRTFSCIAEWVERLRETGTIPRVN